jgi:hypothetical protein
MVSRFRWQIELVFKHLKNLLQLDALPTKDPDLPGLSCSPSSSLRSCSKS